MALAGAFCAAAAFAPTSAAATPLTDELRQFADREVASAAGDMEITVGELDPRVKLAPCARYEPFLPPGSRLWGRSTMGVRCVEGANWVVYIPIQVRVYSPALVAARPLSRNQPLTADDLRIERVELTATANPVLTPNDEFAGSRLTRSVAAGETITRTILRSPAVVQPGDAVRVVMGGTGFRIAADGKALTMGADGQSVQVALTGGRMVTGVARPGRVIEVK
jgi:flagella basal body P-ring formation protein FlgA